MRVTAENYSFGTAPRAQRATGELRLGFAKKFGITRLTELYQLGCLKARFPRSQDTAFCEAVTLNISGGIAGGDGLATHIFVGNGAQAMVAAVAAEKVYGALVGEMASVRTHITLDAEASLDFLPQETILFNNHCLSRKLNLHMHPSARYLGTESLVFGRAAMGEGLGSGHLRDQIEIRRGEALLFQDMTRLDGDITAKLVGKALAGGAQAMGTVIFVAPDAAEYVGCIRNRLSESGLEGGASAFNGMVLVRVLGDTAALRRAIAGAIAICLKGRALPRVWQA